MNGMFTDSSAEPEKVKDSGGETWSSSSTMADLYADTGETEAEPRIPFEHHFIAQRVGSSSPDQSGLLYLLDEIDLTESSEPGAVYPEYLVVKAFEWPGKEGQHSEFYSQPEVNRKFAQTVPVHWRGFDYEVVAHINFEDLPSPGRFQITLAAKTAAGGEAELQSGLALAHMISATVFDAGIQTLGRSHRDVPSVILDVFEDAEITGYGVVTAQYKGPLADFGVTSDDPVLDYAAFVKKLWVKPFLS